MHARKTNQWWIHHLQRTKKYPCWINSNPKNHQIRGRSQDTSHQSTCNILISYKWTCKHYSQFQQPSKTQSRSRSFMNQHANITHQFQCPYGYDHHYNHSWTNVQTLLPIHQPFGVRTISNPLMCKHYDQIQKPFGLRSRSRSLMIKSTSTTLNFNKNPSGANNNPKRMNLCASIQTHHF